MKAAKGAALLAPLVLCACGIGAAHGNGSVRPEEGESTVSSLTCKTDEHSMATIDFATSSGGEQTPEAAAQALVRPGADVAVQDGARGGATAYLLRSDGTAYSKLGLITLEDGTWRVDTMESCAGEGPGSD